MTKTFDKYIRGLADMKICLNPTGPDTMPAETEFKTIGEIKEGGLTLAPGSTSKEYLKKEGAGGLEIVDVMVTKEADTAKGKLIVKDLEAFADITGGAIDSSKPGKVVYTGPVGAEPVDVAIIFETATKVNGQPVTRNYPLAKLTVQEDFVLSAKNWWEASIEIEFLSQAQTVYPQAV